MKRLVYLVSFFGLACGLLAQGTFVVPNGLANTEGNSSSADVFNTPGSQFLQVYSASEFGFSPGASGLITSVSFRLDGATAQSFSGLWPNTSITLSTTLRSPDSLSPVYANNLGADGILCFAGSFFIRATNSGIFPRSFEVQIPLTTPFLYDPARGNLSMYVGTFPGPTSLALDAQNAVGDGVGRVFGPQGPNSGTIDSLGLVTRFGITEVPEPGTIRLLAIITVVYFFFFPMRKRSCKKRTYL